MDTLTIIQKLKKKRPELADDPLMAELEMASTGGDEGMGEVENEPMNPKNGGPLSYLDEEEGTEDEAGADALMAELDAEEGVDTEADALAGAEGGPLSYLDDVGAEDEEILDEEEMPPPAPKKRRPYGKMSRV